MTLPVVGGLSAEASLPVNSGVKNPQAILRYALQIDDKPIRVIQKELESISEALRIPGRSCCRGQVRGEHCSGASQQEDPPWLPPQAASPSAPSGGQ